MRFVTCGLAALALVAAGLSACGPSASQRGQDIEARYQAQQNTAHRELDELIRERLSGQDGAIYAQEMYRISQARELRISDLSSEQEIRDVRHQRERPARAAAVGLPANASDEQIYNAQNAGARAESHARRAQLLNVPVSTSDDELDRLDAERRRVQAARRMGLADSATWDGIRAAQDELDRLRDANELGLSPTASVQQIQQRLHERANTPEARARSARFEQLHEARENRTRLQVELTKADVVVRALERGLPADATVYDIERYEIDRVRRAAAILAGLPEGTSWGDIYDATNHENRTFF